MEGKGGVAMELKLKEVAELLNVSSKTVYRWVWDGKIPCYRINHQYRFDLEEIRDWAGIDSGGSASDRAGGVEAEARVDVSELLRRGGIHYNIAGSSVKDVLANAVSQMNLPPSIDRGELLERLERREAMASTAVGDGLAIPHPREPIAASESDERVALCMLHEPIDFHSLDGGKVHSLVVVVSSDQVRHLRIISKLLFFRGGKEFSELLRRRALRDEIFGFVEEMERRFAGRDAERDG